MECHYSQFFSVNRGTAKQWRFYLTSDAQWVRKIEASFSMHFRETYAGILHNKLYVKNPQADLLGLRNWFEMHGENKKKFVKIRWTSLWKIVNKNEQFF